MGPLIRSGSQHRLLSLLTLTISVTCATHAQTSGSRRCVVSGVPSQVRSEGLTERMGDILLTCSGSIPGSVFSGNLQVFLPVAITNRLDASSNTAREPVLSVDYGSGFVPTGITGTVNLT